MIESFSTQPLQAVIPSYLYQQYSDDSDLQAFVDQYNTLSQGYLDWFNQTPLAVYTSPAISGQLLDWTLSGIYGIERPVISNQTVSASGGLNTRPLNSAPLNSFVQTRSGTSQVADDDIYKRTATWSLYKGDGMQMSIQWLRRRIARFIYGAYGSDIDIGLITNIDIKFESSVGIGPYNTIQYNGVAYASATISTSLSNVVLITLANTPIAQTFKALLSQGYLPVPFQLTYSVNLV